ncbi:hypothetical protein [Rhodococcus sp. O3]|uniref:hypothetical protein n=1 Tax=Rhodococcus sp. O3 TaxID=3404919 RepID=UPI003B6777A6
MSDDPTRPEPPLQGDVPPVRSKMLGVAVVAAMALFLAALAFTLSFDALRALAIEINVHPGRAWMAPVAIDVAQAAATAGYVIFRVANRYIWARRYCMTLAVVTVALSVVGNSYHSYQLAARNLARVAAGEVLGFIPQPPAIAAIIAAIFPLLWLALFHLCTMMLQVVIDERARHRSAASTQHWVQPRPVDVTSQLSTAVEHVTEHNHTLAVVPTPVGVATTARAYDAGDAAPVASGDDQVASPASPSAHNTRVAMTTAVDKSADGATRNGYPQTRAGLQRFLLECSLTEPVKEVAAELIEQPHLKQTQVAQRLHVDKSTVSRRWRVFVAAADAEGFTVPPLPVADAIEMARELQPA